MNMLKLRAIEPADADFFFSVENDEDAWQDSDTYAPLSHNQLKRYAENYDADPFSEGQLRLIAVDESEPEIPVGVLDFYDLSPIHSHTWLGIYILPQFRCKGYAGETLRLAANYAAKRLRLRQIGAKIIDSNVVSIKLFEKNGYILRGTLPQWRFTPEGWRDLHIYTLDLS